MKNILIELGLDAAAIVAGIAGGVISLTYEKNLTFLKAISLITTGGLVAAYLTPIIANHYDISLNLQNGLSFILGLISMRLVGYILKLFDKKANIKLNE